MLGGEGEGCQGGGPGEVGCDSQLDGQALVGQLPGCRVYPVTYMQSL